jgi:hypothetical protein
MDVDLFNPRAEDEKIYRESMVVLRSDPPTVPLRVVRGELFLGRTRVGRLPQKTAAPFAALGRRLGPGNRGP